jgi:hypothetical protein
MLNAYAFRATDPADLKAAADPVGPDYDARLLRVRRRATAFIAAWGIHCDPVRAVKICTLLGRPIACLGLTKSGAPKHPLYLKTTTRRRAFRLAKSTLDANHRTVGPTATVSPVG